MAAWGSPARTLRGAQGPKALELCVCLSVRRQVGMCVCGSVYPCGHWKVCMCSGAWLCVQRVCCEYAYMCFHGDGCQAIDLYVCMYELCLLVHFHHILEAIIFKLLIYLICINNVCLLFIKARNHREATYIYVCVYIKARNQRHNIYVYGYILYNNI